MKILLIRLALELLLSVANIDTPMDTEVLISIISAQSMEQL